MEVINCGVAASRISRPIRRWRPFVDMRKYPCPFLESALTSYHVFVEKHNKHVQVNELLLLHQTN